MIDICISVTAKIAEYLVAPIGRPFKYLWNYEANLENLKNEVEELKAKRDTVQLKIKPGEDPFPDVKLWQEKANRIIDDVSEVVGDNPEPANIQCCKGLSCPNLINRYQLSKEAADKLKDVVGLKQQAVDFNEVAYRIIPEQTTLQPHKGYLAFESRKSILKDIIDALRDPDVNIVGIYGMGGVGKTALAREVASEAQQHNLFDKRIFVEVSEAQDFKIIQGVIADNLGLHFNEESVPGRADKLRDQLKKEGKVLLILDNIWGRINFEKVGIPFESDHKGLKLLLTTRNHDVLTNEMESERNFPVHILNEADAWSLFKNTAGTCIEQPARFLFPKLTSLELSYLRELRSFYPGRHKVEGPVLKKLELILCDIDDTDEDDKEEGHDTDEDDEEEGHDIDDEGQMQQDPFFSLVEEAFPCLEELSLDGEHVTMLCQGQFLESLFDRLKILRVNKDHESIFPFGIIQRCQNLEELSLSKSHYKEIFPHGENQTRRCDSLINLMPPPTSFQNLTSLKVERCSSLINMGTSSVAKSLVQLTEMWISYCEKITEVIGNHGDVIEDEIIFKKLKSLKLQGLPSLTSFYSWNFTLKFPSLESLTVDKCPNMKIFSQGDLTTEKLHEVEIDWVSVELLPDFNLNAAIQQSHKKANASRMRISTTDNGASSSNHLE